MSTVPSSTRWYRKNKERGRASSRRWRKKNPRKVKLINWRCKLKKLYGITVEQYDVLLEQQRHRCAICVQPFQNTPHIDHNHKTGKVRGLLCGSCNSGIGFLGDSAALLRRALVYVRA